MYPWQRFLGLSINNHSFDCPKRGIPLGDMLVLEQQDDQKHENRDEVFHL